jgi:hypothetical protein
MGQVVEFPASKTDSPETSCNRLYGLFCEGYTGLPGTPITRLTVLCVATDELRTGRITKQDYVDMIRMEEYICDQWMVDMEGL